MGKGGGRGEVGRKTWGGIVRLETQKESKKALVFEVNMVWACTRRIFLSFWLLFGDCTAKNKWPILIC